MSEAAPLTPHQSFGRYVLYHPIARGGMATVHTARLVGAEGFSRLVAAKRLHPQFTDDPDFVAMFHDEARIASKIHHPNVVPVLDVVLSGQEVFLVLEYVHGVPLNQLMKAAQAAGVPIPIPIVAAIVTGMLAGLHAAHEAKDELDVPLNIVHRDVSPQNVMVSIDGIPRLLDFGIAKARTSSHHTREGVFKGKLAYMAPEQVRMEPVTRGADLYATGVLMWELLANRRYYSGQGDAAFFTAVMKGTLPTVTEALAETRGWIADEHWTQLVALEPIVSRALCGVAEKRYTTAADMLDAILRECPAATPLEVARWVKAVGSEYLDRRQKMLAESEESWRSLPKVSSIPSSAPNSGIQLAATPRPEELMAGTAASLAPPSSFRFSDPPNQTRLLPWALASGLLLVVGMLVGILCLRSPAVTEVSPSAARARANETAIATIATPVPMPAVAAPTAVLGANRIVPAPQPQPLQEPAMAITPGSIQTARPAPVAAPTVLPSIAPAYRVAPTKTASPKATHEAKAPPVVATTVVSAPPAPVVAPVAAPATPKTDCSPPFYFEGAKKIFKPSCL